MSPVHIDTFGSSHKVAVNFLGSFVGHDNLHCICVCVSVWHLSCGIASSMRWKECTKMIGGKWWVREWLKGLQSGRRVARRETADRSPAAIARKPGAAPNACWPSKLEQQGKAWRNQMALQR
eukprot:6459879-Amphidinium_carterae.2